MGLQQFNETQTVLSGYAFVPADAINTNKQVLGAQAQQWRVDVMQAINTDTIAHVVGIYLVAGATSIFLGEVNVGAGAGTGGTAPVDLLSTLQPANFHYLIGLNSVTIQAQIRVAMSAGTTLQIVVEGGLV